MMTSSAISAGSLTERQERFLSLFLGGAKGNATAAARMAGYAHPHVQGARLLANASIRAAVTDANATIRREGIALKQVRIDNLVRRSWLMERVIEDRAKRYGEKTGAVAAAGRAALAVLGHEVPDEAATGVLAEKQTVAANGRLVTEWAVDTGLLRAMCDHEKQIAQELGEWVEKGEVDLTGGITREYHVVRSSSSLPQPVGFDDLDAGDVS